MPETTTKTTIATDGKSANGHAVTHTTTVVEEKEQKGIVRRLLPYIFLLILIVGAIYGWNIIQYNKVHETTDDAQIDADITPILPRVAGYVTYISVKENDHVDSNAIL